ncbi:MAG: sigma-70 family RNA polymerase sigma factor [Sphingomonas sp.]|jgi:RNA polymerase sigma-70 factor (ECF subfamily)|uniref:sigma-70 family RNA polymerase sigma factor n=1 Tax=Sphingomonas sp. TaxID=28214 RepID=UPI00356734B3
MDRRGSIFRPRLVFNGRARAGDAAVSDEARRFREVMLPHLDAAYSLARYLTADPTAAEDIAQEAFLNAFRAFGSYQGGSAKAWLFAIVRNCWRDRARAAMARSRVLIDQAGLSEGQAAAIDNYPDEGETPEAALLRQQEVEGVRTVIAALPEPFREALVLREMEQMSYREIAAVTEVPIGTVMSRLARARDMLATLLLPQRDAPQEECA